MGAVLLAVVAEGSRGAYLSADEAQVEAAHVSRPAEYPDAKLPYNPRNFNTPITV